MTKKVKQSSKSKTKVKSVKKKKQAPDLKFVLDGSVYLEETDEDGKVERTDVDGNIVLQLLVHTLNEGLELLEKKDK